MQVIEKNALFTEVSAEESAIVSGGVSTLTFNLDNYLFAVGAGVLFGPPGLTNDELLLALKLALQPTETVTNGTVITA